MEQTNRHDGEKLLEVLTSAGWAPQKLAETIGVSRRTIYDWYSKPVLKMDMLNRVIKATGIPLEEFRPPENMAANDDGTPAKKPVNNIGLNVRTTLKSKGIKHSQFARKMGYTRMTFHSRMKEKQWDEGEILKAAQILEVPVAQLKGKGTGQRGFEKDIYDELKAIKDTLHDIQTKLFFANK